MALSPVGVGGVVIRENEACQCLGLRCEDSGGQGSRFKIENRPHGQHAADQRPRWSQANPDPASQKCTRARIGLKLAHHFLASRSPLHVHARPTLHPPRGGCATPRLSRSAARERLHVCGMPLRRRPPAPWVAPRRPPLAHMAAHIQLRCRPVGLPLISQTPPHEAAAMMLATLTGFVRRMWHSSIPCTVTQHLVLDRIPW